MRLVDKDCLIQNIVNKYCSDECEDNCKTCGIGKVLRDIAQTVEIDPGVRCRDCQYCQPMWSGGHPEDKAIEYFCSELGLWRMRERNNGYCYWGKKREDGDNH